MGSAAEDPAAARARMVEDQIVARGVRDPRVLEAMHTVPRHRFVPPAYQGAAYDDHPLPIGDDQTISQPYIVARMTELLDLGPDDRVFELGTGSGYQAAVASRIADHVYTVEIHPRLAERAAAVLEELDYDNVSVRAGDGTKGWPEAAPFDAIVVTAAFPRVPPTLAEQLRPGGRAVLPIGPAGEIQKLVLVRKDEAGNLHETDIFDVRFVPGLGEETGIEP